MTQPSRSAASVSAVQHLRPSAIPPDPPQSLSLPNSVGAAAPLRRADDRRGGRDASCARRGTRAEADECPASQRHHRERAASGSPDRPRPDSIRVCSRRGASVRRSRPWSMRGRHATRRTSRGGSSIPAAQPSSRRPRAHRPRRFRAARSSSSALRLGTRHLRRRRARRHDAGRLRGHRPQGLPRPIAARCRGTSLRRISPRTGRHRTAFDLGPDGWSYLAAIGKIESDHGRSSAPGVHSGQNATAAAPGRCRSTTASAPAAARGAPTRSTATATAAPTSTTRTTPSRRPRTTSGRAARRPTGARAVRVQPRRLVRRRRHPAGRGLPRAGGSRPSRARPVGPVASDGWLAPVPGFPGERCDRRIVADVVRLTRAYGLHLTDCFGGAPHELDGEHPLGLAADVVARRRQLEPHAAARERRRLVARVRASGLPGPRAVPRGPLQRLSRATAIRASRARPHLHLSWQHGAASPFSPAPWVRTVLSRSAGRAMTASARSHELRAPARGKEPPCSTHLEPARGEERHRRSRRRRACPAARCCSS